MPRWTEAEILVKIAELEDALHQLRLAPTKATTGDDSYDNQGRASDLEGAIEEWEERLATVRNGGHVIRQRRRV